MKIGVDVDGVLTDMASYQLEYGKKYFLKKNPNLEIDETGYDICDIFHCTKAEREKFWTKYIWKYCLAPHKYGASKMINKLKEEGHEIHIITGRAHTTEEGVLGNIFRKMLIWRLKKDGIKYDSIHFVSESGSGLEKQRICKELGIDVLIDDKKENVEQISEDIPVICVDNPYNKECIGDNIYRVNNLYEMSNLIRNGLTKDNLEHIVSDYNPFYADEFKTRYGIVRMIGAPLFKILLKPTIIDKNNVPKEGAIILCGNHLHVWDQFPLICATKRTTHWMSKKEYFESKLGPFFRATGAISVDRYGDPTESVNISQNYLNIGSAVGLFPEGTRNHLKDEKIEEFYKKFNLTIDYETFITKIKTQNALFSQMLVIEKLINDKVITSTDLEINIDDINGFLKKILSEEDYNDSLLLPFKYGAVSMAKKTNATIVPFAVTGDYKVGSDNLVVSIGEGFKVGEMSLEEANEILRGKIKTLMIENRKK